MGEFKDRFLEKLDNEPQVVAEGVKLILAIAVFSWGLNPALELLLFLLGSWVIMLFSRSKTVPVGQFEKFNQLLEPGSEVVIKPLETSNKID